MDDLQGMEGPELRKLMEEIASERDVLREEIRRDELAFAIEDAGFDPESIEGKAIVKTWDPEQQATPENVAAYAAEEFGITPGPRESDVAAWLEAERAYRGERITQGEQALSMLSMGTLTAREPSKQDEMDRAQADGDWETFDRLAAQRLITGR